MKDLQFLNKQEWGKQDHTEDLQWQHLRDGASPSSELGELRGLMLKCGGKADATRGGRKREAQGDKRDIWFCWNLPCLMEAGWCSALLTLSFLSCLPRIKALERTLTHGPVLCVTVKATKARENVQNHKQDKHPGLPPPQNGLFFKLVSGFLYSLNYLCDKFSNLLLMPYNHSSPSIRFPGARRGTPSPWGCLEEKAQETVQSGQGDYGPSPAAKWKHYLPGPSLCIHFLPQTFHFSPNGFCTVRSTLINNAHFSGIVKMFVKGY